MRHRSFNRLRAADFPLMTTWATIERDEMEFDVEITFKVTHYSPGAPEQGPSYASGGQPAEPAEFEFEVVETKISEDEPKLTEQEHDNLCDWFHAHEVKAYEIAMDELREMD